MSFISDILDDVLPGVVKIFEVPGSISVSNVTYNPLTQVRADTPNVYAADFTPLAAASQRDIDGTEVQIGDYVTTVPVGVIPLSTQLNGAAVTIAGKTYQVVKVDPIFAGTTPSAYTLYLRGTT